MSSNNTNDGSGSGSDDDDNRTELIVALVALVISVLAFVISMLQALQQYYASATGYSSCTPKVMGDWARFTHRRFRWYEFRFEVEFEVPIIFVAPPTNASGPLGLHKDKEITYMTGTSDSYKKTFTWNQQQYDKIDKSLRAGNSRQAIHTADNELANWLGLLMAIQRMEKESRIWQDNEYFGHSNPQWEDQTPCHPHTPAVVFTHTLTVGMQRKKKSWDSMPDNMKKPYATTTISHLVEIAGMLGVHWKEFNRNEDRYRAQGNGFSITGYDVDDLGIVFTFEKIGPTWFHENRIVPHNLVKELFFGYCPTIFRPVNSSNHKYADEPKDIGTLQLGSMSAIAETLVVIGCNTNAVQYFRKPQSDTRHVHLFPIAFELLGMVGVVLQIPGTAFRMLPNPTIWHWDRKSFSLRTFLGDYVQALSEASAYDPRLNHTENTRIAAMIKEAGKIEDKFLEMESRDGPEAILRPTSNTEEKIYSNDLVMVLHSAISRCDEFLTNPLRINLVQNVLRVHLQEVLRILNDTEGEYKAAEKGRENNEHLQDPVLPGVSSAGRANEEREEVQKEISLLQKLDLASSSERHGVLADIYLFSVRKRVIEVVCRQLLIGKSRRERARSFISTASGEPQNHDQGQRVNDIWCMLVFRMVCWLLLHDFHGKDIHVEKSEVFGSRLPVYLS
ncbi:modin [Colletotrichum graminicola]|uniref:Modin n=1 Tax=Colletotrichum graminicola (strain M1.001 / M2 / FGSC 10212) TaxID=645133 RepID=E3QL07_COLGM|nr:modin [Colletotrichum graminicola M1.001]EFQ31545.1 modin [Colletotrichum graminicola M1.001]WDK10224.1 modin [Colletotrichum graminicola]